MNLQKKIDKIVKIQARVQQKMERKRHKRNIRFGVDKTLVMLQDAVDRGIHEVRVDLEGLYGTPKAYLCAITDRLNNLPYIKARLDSGTYEIHVTLKTGADR
jgi:hypothetical protein